MTFAMLDKMFAFFVRIYLDIFIKMIFFAPHVIAEIEFGKKMFRYISVYFYIVHCNQPVISKTSFFSQRVFTYPYFGAIPIW